MIKTNIFLIIIIILLCGTLWKYHVVETKYVYKVGKVTAPCNFNTAGLTFTDVQLTEDCTENDMRDDYLDSTTLPNKMEQGDVTTYIHCDDEGTGACLCPMYQKEIDTGTLQMWDQKSMDYCVNNGLVKFNQ